MASRRFYPQIFLVSFAALLLEIAYTRIVAFKFYYYFTYLVIGFALLGLGSGGVFVAVSSRLRAVAAARLIAVCCSIGGLTVAGGYLTIAFLELDTFKVLSSASEFFRLALLCFALFLTFVVVGIILARILGGAPEVVNRLYFADLAGAALACGAAVPVIDLLSPPSAVFLGGTALVVAGLPLARSHARGLLAPAGILAVVLAVVALAPGALPDPVVDDIKTLNPRRMARTGSKLLFSKWSPVFRIDVFERPGFPNGRLIAHDGILGSTIQRFDGDLASLSRFERDPRAYPFKVGKPSPRVLIVGAAGGHEILASLYFGAEHVTGIELNPVTVSLITDRFADYSGRLAEHERVTLINDEGRSFLAGRGGTYDLVYFVAPDSYTAMNAAASGAFVLSESYLYTSEMIRETFGHLADDGLICMQFGEFFYERKPNRTARYAATARRALAEMGIRDFARHILVATNPDFISLSTILIKKTPFTGAEIERFLQTTEGIRGARARHAWGLQLDGGPVNQAISLPDDELDRWLDEHPYNLRPISDDSPFFWHFARFRDALGRETDVAKGLLDHEDAVGERVLLGMLAISALFAAAFLLLPFAAVRGTWAQLPYKGRSAIYFGALGLGFLFFEISLIQKLTLFLGFPTYSLIVTLLSLLLFAALGSLAAGSYAAARDRALWILFAALVAVALVHRFALPAAIDALVGSPLPVRVAVSMAFIAPLGLCLGAFMPLGLATVAGLTARREQYVAWAWAVNGFFSVVSSVLTTILAMAYGFNLVLGLGVLVYLVAALVLRSLPDESALAGSRV
jgi:hypothetical protein